MFKALVISSNERTADLGCLLAIARSEACRREHVKVNPPVRAIVFVPELGVYVAVYEASINPENSLPRSGVPEVGIGESRKGKPTSRRGSVNE